MMLDFALAHQSDEIVHILDFLEMLDRIRNFICTLA